MPATYMGKAKVRIPSIAADRDIACILVALTTWRGPTRSGDRGREITETLAIPIGHDGIAMHKRHATVFDPKTGDRRGCIAPSVKNFQDAIGKRLSWGREP